MTATLTHNRLISPSTIPTLTFSPPRSPSSPDEQNNKKKCLIFFIPGNPGLITYYTPFLTHLSALLTSNSDSNPEYHIHGQNLLGFSDTDHPPFSEAQKPFYLEDQIRYFHQQVIESSRGFDSVILVGHSVGAYIAVEVLSRRHAAGAGYRVEVAVVAADTEGARAGAVLLFPAVAHLAKSSNGRKLNMVRENGWLDRWAHHVARGFVGLWPEWVLRGVVRWGMGFPEHAAETTVRFLRSRDGIWQAIHLGKDELAVIGEDVWKEDMWELTGDDDEGEGERFVFYFGVGDRWVADECRDAFIIRRKGHAEGNVKIVMDEAGIPHAFCIHHSEQVAEKVARWVQDMSGV